MKRASKTSSAPQGPHRGHSPRAPAGKPRVSGRPAALVIARRRRGGARLLAGAGFDGLVVENYGDLPFLSGRVGPETVAAMALVAGEIKRAVSIPVGVNVLRNDAAAALAIAGVCGCEFVRVNVLVGAFVTSEGVVEGQPGEVMRLRQSMAPGCPGLCRHDGEARPPAGADHARGGRARRGGARQAPTR